MEHTRKPVGAWLAAAFAFVAMMLAVAYGDQLMGVGGGYFSARIAATTTSGCVRIATDAGGSEACALFPAGNNTTAQTYAMVQVVAYGAGRCGFALDPASTLGAMIWDGGGTNGLGGGDIRSFAAAGEEWHTRPDWNMLRSLPGGWAGICSTALAATAGGARDSLFQPCRQTSDCTSGTCTTSGFTEAQLARVGAYLICESDSGTVNFDVHKELVRR